MFCRLLLVVVNIKLCYNLLEKNDVLYEDNNRMWKYEI